MVLALKEFTSLAVNAYYVSIPISCINAQMYAKMLGGNGGMEKQKALLEE